MSLRGGKGVHRNYFTNLSDLHVLSFSYIHGPARTGPGPVLSLRAGLSLVRPIEREEKALAHYNLAHWH
jgi:hypothetical protein